MNEDLDVQNFSYIREIHDVTAVERGKILYEQACSLREECIKQFRQDVPAERIMQQLCEINKELGNGGILATSASDSMRSFMMMWCKRKLSEEKPQNASTALLELC